MKFHEGANPDVVLLVGGLGTRLRSTLGESTPKSLALIKGRPFLWYLLHEIARQDFLRVKLATAHLSDAYQSELQSYAPVDMDIQFSFEASPRGTSGAIVEALPMVESDPFIAMNGDCFVRAPLAQMVEFHRRVGAVATLGLVEVDDVGRFGTVRSHPDGSVEAFVEKSGLSVPGVISAGVYVLSKDAFEPVISAESSSIEREVFPYWVGKGLYGFQVEPPFIDIGLPETYRDAGRFFESLGYE